jgi:glucan phosphoethanolaminetransferase (alkaline phosphatase superfamily)
MPVVPEECYYALFYRYCQERQIFAIPQIMKLFLKKLFAQKIAVNYLYFSFFLLFLLLLTFLHYKTVEPSFSGPSLFFALYAACQAFLEVSLLILGCYLLKRWAPRFLSLLFVCTLFLFLILHFVDFIMGRVMDTSVSYALNFLFSSGTKELMTGFRSMNLNFTAVLIILGLVLSIPLVGIGFYFFTFFLVKLKPLHLSLTQIAITIGMAATTLLVLEITAHPFLTRLVYNKYRKNLPLGMTFLPPIPKYIYLSKPLTEFLEEEEALHLLPKTPLPHLPNIYLFVIETLRKDFVSLAAPHLTAFGEQNMQFSNSFSNSNATYLSWFSIFHSNLPLHWTEARDQWKGGSLPLQFLKKMSYKIHVYSSADLHYYEMDKVLFGNQRELIDKIEEYGSDGSLKACERDARVIDSLQKEIAKEGTIYLIFLDSPHSEYSFPDTFQSNFQPIAKQIDYVNIHPKSSEIEAIKNRYLTSVSYVDHLMGNFFTSLKKENLFDESIIAITGDHGEEFFEEGALFHGTHLNRYQTSVPLLLKFPSKTWKAQTKHATHIDLFPSILHYLTKKDEFGHLFHGSSIFSPHKHNSHVAFLHNGKEKPYEFLIRKKHFSLRASMVDPFKLEIIDLKGILHPDQLTLD